MLDIISLPKEIIITYLIKEGLEEKSVYQKRALITCRDVNIN